MNRTELCSFLESVQMIHNTLRKVPGNLKKAASTAKKYGHKLKFHIGNETGLSGVNRRNIVVVGGGGLVAHKIFDNSGNQMMESNPLDRIGKMIGRLGAKKETKRDFDVKTAPVPGPAKKKHKAYIIDKRSKPPRLRNMVVRLLAKKANKADTVVKTSLPHSSRRLKRTVRGLKKSAAAKVAAVKQAVKQKVADTVNAATQGVADSVNRTKEKMKHVAQKGAEYGRKAVKVGAAGALLTIPTVAYLLHRRKSKSIPPTKIMKIMDVMRQNKKVIIPAAVLSALAAGKILRNGNNKRR